MNKVAVFIDHTNVHYRLREKRKIDPSWPVFYDPYYLAKKLTGNKRELVEVNFFCTHPPEYLQSGTKKDIADYKAQQAYFNAVSELPGVCMYFGKLVGRAGNLQEKDLDTQMSIQILHKAFLQIYDTCIIVANDYDYASAVQIIKSYRKKVVLMYFEGKGSMELRSIVDLTIKARKSHFKKLDIK